MAFDKGRNWVIMESTCSRLTTEVVTKGKLNQAVRSISEGQKVGERKGLHEPQFWSTLTATEPRHKIRLLKQPSLLTVVILWLCCHFPLALPIIYFFWMRKKHYPKGPLHLFLWKACSFLCPASRQLFRRTQMPNRDAKHTRLAFHISTCIYILRRFLPDDNEQAEA